PGPSDRSYGVQVAKLAGLPPDVIERASEVLEKIESQSQIQIPIHFEATTSSIQEATFPSDSEIPDDRPILDVSKVEPPSTRIPTTRDEPRIFNKLESTQKIDEARKKKKQTTLIEFDSETDS
ncbi:MAG: hypothetical protein ACFFCW_21635, partial [Candidatus Hodarchaeota archaeon]